MKFKDLNVGDCFRWDKGIYIKIEEINGFNSVCIQRGKLCCLSEGDAIALKKKVKVKRIVFTGMHQMEDK